MPDNQFCAQGLLHSTLGKLFQTMPADPLAFLIDELQQEQQRRAAGAAEAEAAALVEA